MKISIASDHAGLLWKEKVKAILERLGHTVIDHGVNATDSVDYPDYGSQVAKDVSTGVVDSGVTVCHTGNGMNMTVNRFPGVRGALVLNKEMAHLARAHNNANVLTLSQRFTPESELEGILAEWVSSTFEGGRHTRRVEKLQALENCATNDPANSAKS